MSMIQSAARASARLAIELPKVCLTGRTISRKRAAIQAFSRFKYSRSRDTVPPFQDVLHFVASTHGVEPRVEQTLSYRFLISPGEGSTTSRSFCLLVRCWKGIGDGDMCPSILLTLVWLQIA